MWIQKCVAGAVAALVMTAALDARGETAKTLTPQDYSEIQQLHARYAWLLDRRVADFANTFTSDGEFRVGATRVVGHDALAAMSVNNTRPSSGPTHFVTNIVIEPSPEGARGAAYVVLIERGPDARLAVTQTGTLEDILVKTSDGWRFKRRTLTVNAMPPSSEKREGEK